MTDNDTSTPLPNAQKHIFRWDLDKTYLETDFDSVRELVRTFLQRPEEKTNVPGADALLRELLYPEGREHRLVSFISGSPQQMRAVLEEKFRIDDIEPDFFILKPNLENLFRGRFRAIRGQIGYKLKALLEVRLKSPLANETLFGDDAEQDALIYCLYDDIVAGRVGRAEVAEILKKGRVYPDVIAQILQLIRENTIAPTVSRVFINLNRRTPTARFSIFGERLIPIHNYFQASLVLFADEALTADSLLRIALDMNQRHRYSASMLANSFQDLVRRQRISSSVARRLADQLMASASALAEATSSELRPDVLTREFTSRLIAISQNAPLLTPSPRIVPDYAKLILKHR